MLHRHDLEGTGRPVSHKCRLKPTDDQVASLRLHCAHAVEVWNLARDERVQALTDGTPMPDLGQQLKMLTAARAASSELRAGSAVAQQRAVHAVDKAFRGWRRRPGQGMPPRRTNPKGFGIPAPFTRKLNAKWGEVQVPKVGWVKFGLDGYVLHEIPDGPVSIKVDPTGDWWIIWTSKPSGLLRARTGKSVGIDVGLRHTVTTSDGEFFDIPERFTASERKRFDGLRRQLKRQQPGSNRHERTLKAIAKMERRSENRKQDWIEKTTTELVRRYDRIVFEDFEVEQAANMGHLSRPDWSESHKVAQRAKTYAQSWGTIRRRTEQKGSTATPRTKVERVDQRYTSQTCSRCGYVHHDNRFMSGFQCCRCFYNEHADVNAAKNILAARGAVTGRDNENVGASTNVEVGWPQQ